jgi:hypothetical protein
MTRVSYGTHIKRTAEESSWNEREMIMAVHYFGGWASGFNSYITLLTSKRGCYKMRFLKIKCTKIAYYHIIMNIGYELLGKRLKIFGCHKSKNSLTTK